MYVCVSQCESVVKALLPAAIADLEDVEYRCVFAVSMYCAPLDSSV
jgi:hypothetical protein